MTHRVLPTGWHRVRTSNMLLSDWHLVKNCSTFPSGWHRVGTLASCHQAGIESVSVCCWGPSFSLVCFLFSLCIHFSQTSVYSILCTLQLSLLHTQCPPRSCPPEAAAAQRSIELSPSGSTLSGRSDGTGRSLSAWPGCPHWTWYLYCVFWLI